MRAGDLDIRIIIQSSTESIDSQGGVTLTWSTVATVWAKKLPMAVKEGYSIQQELAQAQLIYRIRYRSDITPKMRLKVTNNDSPETFKYYDILGTKEIGRTEGLEIYVNEIVS